MRRHHPPAGDKACAGLPGHRRQRRIDVGAAIDDRGDRHSGSREIRDGAPSVVAGGEDCGPAPRRDAEAVDVGPHRSRKHDARPVVAAEDDRPLGRAGGENRALGHDAPGALPRLVLRRHGHVIVDAFERAEGAVIVDAEHGRPAHDADLGQAFQLGDRRVQPLLGAAAVDRAPLGQKAPAEAKILVAQDDARAGASGGERGREAGRPAPDDEHVAEGDRLLVMVRILVGRGSAEPRGAPDEGLVEPFPKARRPHEGLVVEPGPQAAATAAR